MARRDKKPRRGYQRSSTSPSETWWRRMEPDARRRAALRAVWVVFGLLAIGGAVAGMSNLRERVIQRCYAGPNGRAVVRVTSVPAWMPVSLASQVSYMITPRGATLSDEQLAHKVYKLAEHNPLVASAKRVEVRPNPNRPGGVVEVDLEFRHPIARVTYGGEYVYVDEHGVCMPKEFVPMYVVTDRDAQTQKVVRQACYQARGEVPPQRLKDARLIHYVTIDGVAQSPPKAGHAYKSDDLAAAIKLVKLLRCRPYFAQIKIIDVRNHGGRISRSEPELRMYAQIGQERMTDIRFGRLPRCAIDCIISPRRKIWYLDDYAANHNGRIAGINSYLDLRYDNLHVSVN